MNMGYIDEMVQDTLKRLLGTDNYEKELTLLAHNVRLRADQENFRAIANLYRENEGKYCFDWSFVDGKFNLKVIGAGDGACSAEFQHVTISHIVEEAKKFCRIPVDVILGQEASHLKRLHCQ